MSDTIYFGPLRSFGNYSSGGSKLVFRGSGAVSPNINTGFPINLHPQFVNTLISVGREYPYDSLGLSPSELAGPFQISYEYLLLADPTLSDSAAFKDLRVKYNKIWTWFTTTYTLDSITGVSGQRGYLVVEQEDSSSVLYKAKARCLEPGTLDFVKGEPHNAIVHMTFGLLSDFTLVT